MAKVLSHLGYQIEYNSQQTCCGQPAFNAGYRDEARKVAAKFIEVFTLADVIVSPSGSCTAMVKNYYSTLFANDSQKDKDLHLGRKIFEFSEFLAHEDQIKNISGQFKGTVGFHNSCHSYRELGIDHIHLNILQKIEGIEIVHPSGEPV